MAHEELKRKLLSSDRPPIHLRVTGGPPRQRFDLDLRIEGDGTIVSRLHDDLERRETSKRVKLEHARLEPIYAEIARSGLLDTDAKAAPFIPDSLIGVIEIEGNRWLFYADREQAEAADARAPEGILAATRQLMQVAASALNLPSISPTLVGDPQSDRI